MSRGAPAKKPRRNARELTTSRPPPENLSVRTDRVRAAKKTSVREMDAYWTLYQISLFLPEISLFFKIFSLLICVGHFVKSRCSTVVSCNEIGFSGPRNAKFPVNFPVSRELQVETGSHMTAYTTTQSSRTAETVVDRK